MKIFFQTCENKSLWKPLKLSYLAVIFYWRSTVLRIFWRQKSVQHISHILNDKFSVWRNLPHTAHFDDQNFYIKNICLYAELQQLVQKIWKLRKTITSSKFRYLINKSDLFDLTIRFHPHTCYTPFIYTN